MNFGGKGANQAVVAVHLGGDVSFIYKIGNDVFENQLLELYKSEMINTKYIFTDSENPNAFPFKPCAQSERKVRASEALYPFRHGLSYITFECSDLKMPKPQIGTQGEIELSYKVRKIDKRTGDEIVQLYIRDDYSSVTTYEKISEDLSGLN